MGVQHWDGMFGWYTGAIHLDRTLRWDHLGGTLGPCKFQFLCLGGWEWGYFHMFYFRRQIDVVSLVKESELVYMSTFWGGGWGRGVSFLLIMMPLNWLSARSASGDAGAYAHSSRAVTCIYELVSGKLFVHYIQVWQNWFIIVLVQLFVTHRLHRASFIQVYVHMQRAVLR